VKVICGFIFVCSGGARGAARGAAPPGRGGAARGRGAGPSMLQQQSYPTESYEYVSILRLTI
jgi:hypothetical protein